MKKNIFFAVVATCIVAFLFSFTLLTRNPIHKIRQLNSCGASATNLHIIRSGGGYITFGWDGVNSPDHYNYGGYYQSGGNSNYSGTAYGNEVTIEERTGGRFSVAGTCADGTSGGSVNMLFQ